jgi:hypothetical protein
LNRDGLNKSAHPQGTRGTAGVVQAKSFSISMLLATVIQLQWQWPNGLGIRAVDPIRGLKGRNTILREADAAFFEITISKGSCRGFTVPGAESSPLPRGGHSCAESLLREYW